MEIWAGERNFLAGVVVEQWGEEEYIYYKYIYYKPNHINLSYCCFVLNCTCEKYFKTKFTHLGVDFVDKKVICT